ncbi:MAG: HAD-IIIA family hydrolase [Clostridia bacterium]|nr:HAD-IIIA family hydrolase [Clostridia bacterium]
MKLRQALILAGGKGTRMREITGGLIPKPLVRICGKPILERTIENLRMQGIEEITVSVGYLHEQIVAYFGDGEKYGVKIRYIVEKEPLGSGGALYYLKESLKEPLLVCPGDVVFDIDIGRMFSWHLSKQALITLFVHPNTHPQDSDVILSDPDGRVTGILRKNEERHFYYANVVNAGILILSPETLSYFETLKPVNMEHDFVSSFIGKGAVYAYRSPEYIRDAGTPERFAQVEKDILNGTVAAKNLSRRQKAVFLDRDGTLNVYKGFLTKPDELELMPGAADAIKKINRSGYLAVIVSNQPVIARGECTEEGMREIFNKLETLLGQEGAYLDGIYYCPHHPDSGFPGEIKALKIKCGCRKPNTGMLKKAAEDLNLDLARCIMIGDDLRDAQTAENASIPCVLIANERLKDTCGTELAPDILSAVDMALERYGK